MAKYTDTGLAYLKSVYNVVGSRVSKESKIERYYKIVHDGTIKVVDVTRDELKTNNSLVGVVNLMPSSESEWIDAYKQVIE